MHEAKRFDVPKRDIIIMIVVFLWVLSNGWILAIKYAKKEYAYNYIGTSGKSNMPISAPISKPITITVTDHRQTDSIKTVYEQRINILDSTINVLNEQLKEEKKLIIQSENTRLKIEKKNEKNTPSRGEKPANTKASISIAENTTQTKSTAPAKVIPKKKEFKNNPDSGKETSLDIAKLFNGVMVKTFTNTENGYEHTKTASKVNMIECCIETKKYFSLDKPLRIYFTVISPDGHVINGHRSEEYGRLFSFKGNLSSKNTETNKLICCKLPINDTLIPGTYILGVYSEAGKIGEALYKVD